MLGELSACWGISPSHMPQGDHKPPRRDALVPQELQCAWEGWGQQPPPGMENQGISL